MVGQGGRGAADVVQVCPEVAPAVRVVHHQVDGHLALQTADVPVAEVVAELVDLDTGYSQFNLSRPNLSHIPDSFGNTNRAVFYVIA